MGGRWGVGAREKIEGRKEEEGERGEGRKRGRKNGLAEFCCWNSIESISREPFIQETCYQMV